MNKPLNNSKLIFKAVIFSAIAFLTQQAFSYGALDFLHFLRPGANTEGHLYVKTKDDYPQYIEHVQLNIAKSSDPASPCSSLHTTLDFSLKSDTTRIYLITHQYDISKNALLFIAGLANLTDITCIQISASYPARKAPHTPVVIKSTAVPVPRLLESNTSSFSNAFPSYPPFTMTLDFTHQ